MIEDRRHARTAIPRTTASMFCCAWIPPSGVRVGGILNEAFDARWAPVCQANDDDPGFDERTEFDELLEIVDGLAQWDQEFVIEGGPGMTSAYRSFYVSSAAMKAVKKAFAPRER